jgi:drug/metabolite transporter (DMT)-like permease
VEEENTPDARLPVAGYQPTRAAGVGILLIVAFIWGTTFVAMKQLVTGSESLLKPGAVTFWRFAIAALVFAPALLRRRLPRELWIVGFELSLWLWAGYATQAIGIQYTTISRSAFVTSLNVVFVPMLAALAGHRVGGLVWSMVALALAGAALLSYDGGDPNVGDLWTLGCAMTYAVYIIRLERHSKRFDSLPLTAVQLLGVAMLSLPWMAFEAGNSSPVTWPAEVIATVLYLGLVATLLTIWLQAVGQKAVPATHASLLYTMEPVFASGIALLFFNDRLGLKGWSGALLLLTAAFASQAVPLWVERNRRAKADAAVSG